MGKKEDASMSSQGIQSLEMAFTILDCFKEANIPMSVSELSSKMNIPKNRIHKYLVSFKRVGALIQNKDDLTYSMGPKLIELGLTALEQVDIASIAEPYIKALGKELNQSIALAIWSEKEPIVVKYEKSKKPIQVEIQLGYRVPLMSAVGKCFVAFTPSAQVKSLIQQEIKKYQLNEKDVEAELNTIREEHLSFRNTPFEGVPGSIAIASPIFDFTGNIVASLCVIGFEGDLSYAKTSQEVTKLKETGKQISKLLS